MTDVVHVQPVYVTDDGTLINPTTGNEVGVNSEDGEIVSFLRWLRGAIAEAHSLDRDMQAILRDRADAREKYSGPGWRVPGPNAGAEWDEVAVSGEITQLIAEGKLPPEAHAYVFRTVTKFDAKALAELIATQTSSRTIKRLRACKTPPKGTRRVEV